MNEIQLSKHSPKNKDLSFQLNNGLFADVILNFLGKKEKLKYKPNLFFLLRLNDIEQFYYLINQKVSKEQNIFIDHFLVNFTYNDGTVREISGINALNKFKETRDVIPKDVTLSWNILIKYPNAETVENQKIELSFIRNENNNSQGEVILVISHTNQSWGIEVLNLLKDKIAEVTIKQHKAHLRAENARVFFDFKLMFLFVMLITFGTLLIQIMGSFQYEGSKYYYDMIEIWKNSPDLSEIEMSLFAVENMNGEDLQQFNSNYIDNNNLKSILSNIAEVKNKTEKFGPLLLWFIGSFGAISLSIWYYLGKVINYYGFNCYILISRRSEVEYEDYLSIKNKMKFFPISFIVIAVVCGVIANFVFRCFFV